MPLSLPTWLVSAAKYIKFWDNAAKAPGVHLYFPDLTSVTAESAAFLTANGVSGFASTGASYDGLNAAVAVEKVNISLGLPIWLPGTRLANGDEPGIVRKWTLGTGGSNSANAAASNASRFDSGEIPWQTPPISASTYTLQATDYALQFTASCTLTVPASVAKSLYGCLLTTLGAGVVLTVQSDGTSVQKLGGGQATLSGDGAIGFIRGQATAGTYSFIGDSSGGSFASLSDKATVDLTTVNTPLASKLATLTAASLSVALSTGLAALSVANGAVARSSAAIAAGDGGGGFWSYSTTDLRKTITSATGNVLSSVAHGFQSGAEVVAKVTTGAGLVDGTTYFLRRESADTYTLYDTFVHAMNVLGTTGQVALAGTPVGTIKPVSNVGTMVESTVIAGTFWTRNKPLGRVQAAWFGMTPLASVTPDGNGAANTLAINRAWRAAAVGSGNWWGPGIDLPTGNYTVSDTATFWSCNDGTSNTQWGRVYGAPTTLVADNGVSWAGKPMAWIRGGDTGMKDVLFKQLLLTDSTIPASALLISRAEASADPSGYHVWSDVNVSIEGYFATAPLYVIAAETMTYTKCVIRSKQPGAPCVLISSDDVPGQPTFNTTIGPQSTTRHHFIAGEYICQNTGTGTDIFRIDGGPANAVAEVTLDHVYGGVFNVAASGAGGLVNVTATAAASATSITITPLSFGLPLGQRLTFGGVIVILSAAYTAGGGTLTVQPLSAQITSGTAGGIGSSLIGMHCQNKIVTSGAASGATSVPIVALAFNVPSGTVLIFTSGNSATLTADYTAGGTTMTVSALGATLLSGESSQTYKLGDYKAIIARECRLETYTTFNPEDCLYRSSPGVTLTHSVADGLNGAPATGALQRIVDLLGPCVGVDMRHLRGNNFTSSTTVARFGATCTDMEINLGPYKADIAGARVRMGGGSKWTSSNTNPLLYTNGALLIYAATYRGNVWLPAANTDWAAPTIVTGGSSKQVMQYSGADHYYVDTTAGAVTIDLIQFNPYHPRIYIENRGANTLTLTTGVARQTDYVPIIVPGGSNKTLAQYQVAILENKGPNHPYDGGRSYEVLN